MKADYLDSMSVDGETDWILGHNVSSVELHLDDIWVVQLHHLYIMILASLAKLSNLLLIMLVVSRTCNVSLMILASLAKSSNISDEQ